MSTRTQKSRPEYFAITAFAVCSLAAAIKSKGFLEADGCTHYLFARFAFQHPVYFVDVWGRPLCTALYSIPARAAGLLGVRFTSLLIALATAWVARAIAIDRNYRWPSLALIFTLGQPLLFFHSFSELTELPFALIMGLALLAYSRRHWLALAFLAALAPLARPEGFALLIPIAFLLMAHRRFAYLLVLPIGLILWSIAGHHITGDMSPWYLWLPNHWPYASHSEYASGSPFHFIALLPMIVGPLALPATCMGMLLNLRQARHLAKLRQDHRARVDALIALIPLSVLVGHSILYAGGWLSSNGELRYLLIAAPMWGLLSARGWQWIFEQTHWKQPIAKAALAAVLPGLVNYYWRVIPLTESTDWLAAKQCAQWFQQTPLRSEYPKILCNHPALFYYLDQCPLDEMHSAAWTGDNIDHPPPGVILIWDPIYSVFNANPKAVMKLDRIRAAGWKLDFNAQFVSGVSSFFPDPDFSKQWHIFLSPNSAKAPQ